eukprot:157146-Chlamydomonas_euryale.AAC.6
MAVQNTRPGTLQVATVSEAGFASSAMSWLWSRLPGSRLVMGWQSVAPVISLLQCNVVIFVTAGALPT